MAKAELFNELINIGKFYRTQKDVSVDPGRQENDAIASGGECKLRKSKNVGRLLGE